MNSVCEATRDWAHTKKISMHFSETTGSTNDQAKSVLPGNGFELWLTDHQTSGRGRGDNEWVDLAKGTSLLSSWCFSLSIPPQPITSPLAGLALYKASKQTWPELRWSLKAPNDLYIQDRKAAGLLIENVSFAGRQKLVMGLGFNVKAHPEVSNAGHIEEFLKRHVTHEEWWQFLEAWWSGICQIAMNIGNTKLSDHQREEILEALNARPGLETQFDEVLPDGGLRVQNKTISWTEL